jgi:hypothetical protein
MVVVSRKERNGLLAGNVPLRELAGQAQPKDAKPPARRGGRPVE